MNERVWVAGHSGLVGSALVRRLRQTRADVLTVTRAEVDLREQSAVNRWLADQRPDSVIIAAATVGGTEANPSRPAAFLYDNLMIAANIIQAAGRNGGRQLMFRGSSWF